MRSLFSDLGSSLLDDDPTTAPDRGRDLDLLTAPGPLGGSGARKRTPRDILKQLRQEVEASLSDGADAPPAPALPAPKAEAPSHAPIPRPRPGRAERKEPNALPRPDAAPRDDADPTAAASSLPEAAPTPTSRSADPGAPAARTGAVAATPPNDAPARNAAPAATGAAGVDRDLTAIFGAPLLDQIGALLKAQILPANQQAEAEATAQDLDASRARGETQGAYRSMRRLAKLNRDARGPDAAEAAPADLQNPDLAFPSETSQAQAVKEARAKNDPALQAAIEQKVRRSENFGLPAVTPMADHPPAVPAPRPRPARATPPRPTAAEELAALEAYVADQGGWDALDAYERPRFEAYRDNRRARLAGEDAPEIIAEIAQNDDPAVMSDAPPVWAPPAREAVEPPAELVASTTQQPSLRAQQAVAAAERALGRGAPRSSAEIIAQYEAAGRWLGEKIRQGRLAEALQDPNAPDLTDLPIGPALVEAGRMLGVSAAAIARREARHGGAGGLLRALSARPEEAAHAVFIALQELAPLKAADRQETLRAQAAVQAEETLRGAERMAARILNQGGALILSASERVTAERDLGAIYGALPQRLRPGPAVGLPQRLPDGRFSIDLDAYAAALRRLTPAERRDFDARLLQRAADAARVELTKDDYTVAGETVKAVVGGPLDAAQEMVDLGGWALGYKPEEIFSVGQVPPNRSQAGRAARSIGQFAAGFAIGGGALKAAGVGTKVLKGAGAGSRIARGALQGALADFLAFDAHEARLSDMLEQNPSLRNPISAYLKSDQTDGEIEGRLKNALEGVLIGGAADAVLSGLRVFKRAKAAQREAAPQGVEAADAAARRVLADAALSGELAIRLPKGASAAEQYRYVAAVYRLAERPAGAAVLEKVAEAVESAGRAPGLSEMDAVFAEARKAAGAAPRIDHPSGAKLGRTLPQNAAPGAEIHPRRGEPPFHDPAFRRPREDGGADGAARPGAATGEGGEGYGRRPEDTGESPALHTMPMVESADGTLRYSRKRDRAAVKAQFPDKKAWGAEGEVELDALERSMKLLSAAKKLAKNEEEKEALIDAWLSRPELTAPLLARMAFDRPKLAKSIAEIIRWPGYLHEDIMVTMFAYGKALGLNDVRGVRFRTPTDAMIFIDPDTGRYYNHGGWEVKKGKDGFPEIDHNSRKPVLVENGVPNSSPSSRAHDALAEVYFRAWKAMREHGYDAANEVFRTNLEEYARKYIPRGVNGLSEGVRDVFFNGLPKLRKP